MVSPVPAMTTRRAERCERAPGAHGSRTTLGSPAGTAKGGDVRLGKPTASTTSAARIVPPSSSVTFQCASSRLIPVVRERRWLTATTAFAWRATSAR